MEKNKGKAIDEEESPLQDGESTRFCTGSSSSGDLSGVNTDINTDIRDDSNWNDRESRRFYTGSSSSEDLSGVNTDISTGIRDDSNWNAGDSRRFCTGSSSSGDLSGVNTDIRDDSNWNDPLGEDLLDVDAVVRALSQRYDEETSVDSKVRLLVVANRLPVTATRKGDGSWSLDVSAGGLVSALLGVKTFETTWIGWAGINVPDEIGQRGLTKALAEKNSIPVFLDEDLVHQYYNGYCNNILWPLFHYLGLPQDDQPTTTHCFQSQFDAYKKANQLFADVVNEHYQEGDIIWCHDYHLMYLPKFLKEYNPNMKVGWFLHTPFPSSEIHRMLPSRAELLKSVLAADLVGFHTYDYARHFVSACTRILGLEGTPQGVKDQGKLTRVAAFPIGIDSARFIRALEGPDAKQHLKNLQEMFAGRKVIIGVDRLDMIKGIPQKILAFEKFLMENPSWHDKVVLVQIAVPTRIDVPEYKKLTSQVHEIVGRINGRFGTLTGVPIHHLDRSLDFHALCALYATTDVALVTSLRDGMNLVSYEFVACQAAKKGVLILSEFAGAAQSLGAGAILVNPWSISEVASAIRYALNMTMEERVKRHHHNFMHVTTYTAQDWAANFLSELHDITVDAQLKRLQVPRSLPLEGVVEKYHRSNHRLLILGFNATLTETIEYPGRRRGDQRRDLDLKLHPDLKEPLRNLCNDPRTTVVVVSGSDRSVLDHNFGEYNIWLAAENGTFLRPTNGEWIRTMPEHVNMDWVNSVKHVFEYFTERTPRSHYELRETSLVWNYKYSDAEFGRLQARGLLQHLWTGPISNAAVEVLQGNRSVEVRSAGVTKGAAVERIILLILSMLTPDGAGMMGEILHTERTISPIDLVLCAGHFLGKDEDIFTFLEPDRRAESSQAPRANTYTPQVRKWSSEDLTQSKIQRTLSRTHSVPGSLDRRSSNITGGSSSSWRPQQERYNILWNNISSVLNIRSDNYFSIAVGREHSNARYLLRSSEEVVSFLKALAAVSRSSETSLE